MKVKNKKSSCGLFPSPWCSSVFFRPGHVPIQTPPSVRFPDLRANPPTPRRHARQQLHPKSEEEDCAKARGGEDRLSKELTPVLDASRSLVAEQKYKFCLREQFVPRHPVARLS